MPESEEERLVNIIRMVEKIGIGRIEFEIADAIDKNDSRRKLVLTSAGLKEVGGKEKETRFIPPEEYGQVLQQYTIRKEGEENIRLLYQIKQKW